MRIKDFINRIDAEYALTPDVEERLMSEFIPDGLGRILDILNLNEKKYTVTLDNESSILLPVDFSYPLAVKYGDSDVEYDRVDFQYLEKEEQYAIALTSSGLHSYNTAMKAMNVVSASVKYTRSKYNHGYLYTFKDTETPQNEFGKLYDNENVYYPTNTFTSRRGLMFELTNDDDVVRVRDNDKLRLKTEHGIFEVSLDSTKVQYYLAEDGSAYEESALTTLISRAKPIYQNFSMHFYSGLTGAVDIYYRRTKEIYVNVNEDEPLIDRFYTALFVYCLYRLYLSSRKTQLAGVYKSEFNEELIILGSKKGKEREFRIPRRVASNQRPFRYPFQSGGRTWLRRGN